MEDNLVDKIQLEAENIGLNFSWEFGMKHVCLEVIYTQLLVEAIVMYKSSHLWSTREQGKDRTLKGRGRREDHWCLRTPFLHMINSIDAKNKLTKCNTIIKHPYMIETSSKLELETNVHVLIKCICENLQQASYLKWKTEMLSKIRNKARVYALTTSSQCNKAK